MLKAFLLPFADHFRACGWQVDAMSAGIDSTPELSQHFDQLWPVDFSRNPLKIKNLVMTPRQIIKVVKKNHYDIIHVHSPIAAFLCRFALRFITEKNRPKIIYTAHGFHFYKGGKLLNNILYYSLEKIAGRWTDRLITINVDDYVAARKLKIVRRSQLVYMPGIGIDIDYYRQKIATDKITGLRDNLKIKHDEHIFLMVAEFTRQKRQRLVVEAFAELGAANAHLVLVGLGRCFNEIQEWVLKKNLTEKIHLLGFQRDIPLLIHAAFATILVSDREGLPRAILESLCLDTPVIGSNVRGIKNLLRKGGGILIPKGDKKQLISAMQYMLDNPEKTAAMTDSSKKHIKKYELSTIIKRHEELYNQLLNEPKHENFSAYPL